MIFHPTFHHCEYCGGNMKYVGTSNGSETYKCDKCGNQKAYVTS